MKSKDVEVALDAYANTNDARILQGFFKTADGDYAAGDIFIGVRMPPLRKVSIKFSELPISEIQVLLNSKVHEHRIIALVILRNRYVRSSANDQEIIFNLYLKNLYANRINNWDLVDVSAEYIVGAHLHNRSHELLFVLANSKNIWQRRVAILSTFAFIKAGDATTTLKIAQILIEDKQDLIQKSGRLVTS